MILIARGARGGAGRDTWGMSAGFVAYGGSEPVLWPRARCPSMLLAAVTREASSPASGVVIVPAFGQRHDVVADGCGADTDAGVAQLALVVVAGQDTQPAVAVLRCVGACHAGLAGSAALLLMFGAVGGFGGYEGGALVVSADFRRSRHA